MHLNQILSQFLETKSVDPFPLSDRRVEKDSEPLQREHGFTDATVAQCTFLLSPGGDVQGSAGKEA